jgi:hypothetical protein
MMKLSKSVRWYIACAGVALGVAGMVGYAGVASMAASAAEPSTQPGDEDPGRHPEIHRALRQLRAAKERLAAAAEDFGGHRAAALKLTNQAIAECEACLRVDTK